ncbi:MAG TPA: metallophosphoesterase [Bryobacteraceae bacterium]|nr:metallophosphoesterase [Bryobacteraceae bacterium]
MTQSPFRHLPDLVIFFISLLALGTLTVWLLQTRWAHHSKRRSNAICAVAAVLAAWLLASGFWSIPQIALGFPVWVVSWVRGTALAVGTCLCVLVPVAWFWRMAPPFDPRRRRVLNAVRVASFGLPAVVGAFAIIRRNELRLTEIEIPVAGLAADLNGLRLVQLSDIHMSPFLSEADLEHAIGIANETRPHLALITGDLITGPRDPIDRCIERLRGLRADAGAIGCMGNHEHYSNVDGFTQQYAARFGIHFLRRQAMQFRFGKAAINFAGVDYQRFYRPYLKGAEKLIAPGMLNVLLSHNPDVLKTAAAQGWDVTIAGHTHGGQVNFEVLSAGINIARFYTPYIYGLYSEGSSSLFVSRGIGTVGVPARFGAPPEIALIRLRRA